MHFAVTSLFQHHTLLQGCDALPQANDAQNPAAGNKTSTSFMAEFIHQLSEHNLLENSFVATVFPNHANEFQSKLRTEAQDANVDLKVIDARTVAHYSCFLADIFGQGISGNKTGCRY